MNETETTTAPDGTERECPLAWDKDGEPIELPPEAVGWRVRRFKLGAGGGIPEVVYADGIPLIIALDATVEDLIDRAGGKPGRYRLEAVDENGRLLKVPHAFAVIERAATNQGDPQGDPAGDTVRRLVTCIETLLAKITENQATITSNHAAMMNAAGNMLAPVDKRRVPIEIVTPTQEPTSPQGFDWNTFWQTCGPMIQGALGMLMQKMAAPPAAAPPAGGAP